MYNKNQFKKLNDKKVLHKIKKHWAVISVALLGLLGGGAETTTHVSANANVDNQSNNNQAHQQINTNQLQNNQSKLVNNNTQSHNSQSNVSSNNVSQNITKEANQLHNKILMGYMNQANSSEPQKPNKSLLSSSNSKDMTNNSVAKPNISNQSLGVTLSSNNHSNPNQIQTGIYRGLDYTYDPSKKSVKFTNGTAHSDLSYFIKDAPSCIKNASSILFPIANSDDSAASFTTNHINMFYVTNMNHMFASDHNLKLLNFGSSDYITGHVTNMNHMFASDNNLELLCLNNITTTNVTNMDGMFKHDYNLQKLSIISRNDSNSNDYNSINEGDEVISNFRLNNSADLKPLYLKDVSDDYTSPYPYNFNQTRSRVHRINDVFMAHKNPQTGIYDGLTYEYDKRGDTVEFTGGTLNWNGNNNAFIGTGDNAPSYIHDAGHIKFDKGINMNNITSLNNMFLSDTYIKSIDLSNLDTKHITSMSNMFENDTNLQALNLDNFNTSNVTNMNYMLNNDNNLQSLNISSFDTRKASMVNFINILPTVFKIGPLTKFKGGLFTFDIVNRPITNLNSNYNPQNNNPSVSSDVTSFPNIHNGSVVLVTPNSSNSLLMDSNGNNVTSELKNGNLSAGIYYRAIPVRVILKNQENKMYGIQNSITVPVRKVGMREYDGVTGYTINTSPYGYYYDFKVNNFNYNKLIRQQLLNIINNSKIFNNDFSLNNKQDYTQRYTDSDVNSLYINVNVTENYAKFIHDANSIINSDLNNMKQYHNEYDIGLLKSDVLQSQHYLSEPVDWNIVIKISGVENNANNILNTAKNNNRELLNRFIHNNNSRITYCINYIKSCLNSKVAQSNSRIASRINKDENTAQQAINFLNENYNKYYNTPSAVNLQNLNLELGKIDEAEADADNALETHITPNSNKSHSNSSSNSNIQSEMNSFFNSMSSSISNSVSAIEASYSSEIANDNTKINSLNSEISSRSTNPKTSTATNDASLQSSFNNYIKDTNTEINSLTRQINSLSSSKATNSGTNENSEINSLSNKVSSMARNTNVSNNATNSSLNSYMNSTKSEISSLNDKANATSISTLTSELSNDSLEINSLNSNVNAIKQNSVTSNSSEINSLNNEINSMKQSISTVSGYSSLQSSYSNYVKNTNVEINSLNNKISEMAQNTNASTSNNDAILKSSYNSYVSSTNTEISSLSNKVNTNTSTINTSEVNSLNNRINDMKQSIPTVPNYSSLQSSYSNYVSEANSEMNLLNSKISEIAQSNNATSLESSYNSYVNSTNDEIHSLNNKINTSIPANDTSEINSLNNEISSMKQSTSPNYSSLQSSYSNYVSDTNTEISSLNSKVSDISKNTNVPTNNNSAMSAYVNNTNSEISSLTNHMSSMTQSNSVSFRNNYSSLQSSYNSYVGSTNAKLNSLATQMSNSATINSTEVSSIASSLASELNNLSVGKGVPYKNGVVTRNPMHYNLITINKDCLLHNNLSSVGKVTDYAGVLKRGTTVKIIRSFNFKVNGHKYYRYEINLNGNNYYVTANPTFTINTYIMPTEVKNHRKAIISKPCFMYLYGHKHLLRHGSLVRIKRVIRQGKVTRLQLTNGAIITANKRFVKLV